MPQLDLYILSSQIFWLLLKFYLFYFIILNTYIIAITNIFKSRNKFLNRSIDKEIRLFFLNQVSSRYFIFFL